MKNWNAPEVEEVEVSNTQYYGNSTTKFDNTYMNDESVWEASSGVMES